MSKFPICVVIYLTDYCKLRCKHCFLTQTNNINKNMIDFDKIKELLDQLKKHNVFMVAFTGGDPMLHPKIFDILRYTSDLGMLPLLGISGINVSFDMCKKIYECGVRCVQIGLNGSNEQINDLYRGKGNFFEVMSTIENLKQNSLNVNLAFCIDKYNLFDLKNMLNLANALGIYKVKIEFWNCINYNKKTKENELCDLEKQKVRNICKEYMLKNNKNDWIQYPKSSTQLNKIHSNALIVMPNGDVKKNEMDKSIGNINEKNFFDIVEGI